MNAFAWDLESLHGKPESQTWAEYKETCGVSVACAVSLDGLTTRQFSVNDEPPNDLESLRKSVLDADFTVSYNGKAWDRYVLAVATGRPCPPANELDLWDIIKRSLGGEKWEKGTWKLDEVCRRTLKEGKDRSGAGAPSLWAEGRYGALFEYCLRDAELTRRLFWFMGNNGYVVAPYNRIIDISAVMKSELDRTGASKTLSCG